MEKDIWKECRKTNETRIYQHDNIEWRKHKLIQVTLTCIFSLVKLLSHVWLFASPWTVPYQAPPSMGFSRQEYGSGLPFPSPGNLPDPWIKPMSPVLQADTLPSEPPVYRHKKEIQICFDLYLLWYSDTEVILLKLFNKWVNISYNFSLNYSMCNLC